MIPAQVVFREPALDAPDGRRSRKKRQTRLAIEDAAMSLFVEQGYEATTVEEITERADVSTTTFFRYFPSKAEVLLSDHGQQLPALHEAILARPATESDLVAIRRAVQEEWVHSIDAERTARKARIVATSDALSGSSYQRGHRWLTVIADALAQRRGLDRADTRSSLAARVALAALAQAVDDWLSRDCVDDLEAVVDDRFDTLNRLCAEWVEPRPSHAEDER